MTTSRLVALPTRWDEEWIERPEEEGVLEPWLAQAQERLALRRAQLAEAEGAAGDAGEAGEEEVALHQAHLGRALQHVARGLALAQRWEEALEAREEQLRLWQELGRGRAAFVARMHRADVWDVSGRHAWADAELEALDALLGDDAALRFYDFSLATTRGIIWARRGEVARAARAMQRALVLQHQRGIPPARLAPTQAMLERILDAR